MHLALIVNNLPVFKGRGQKLKAHLSIKKYERKICNEHYELIKTNGWPCFSLRSASIDVATTLLIVIIYTVCFLAY